jgi:7-cyano-7-deazaguanine synthase in queuosine biosynthesis
MRRAQGHGIVHSLSFQYHRRHHIQIDSVEHSLNIAEHNSFVLQMGTISNLYQKSNAKEYLSWHITKLPKLFWPSAGLAYLIRTLELRAKF